MSRYFVAAIVSESQQKKTKRRWSGSYSYQNQWNRFYIQEILTETDRIFGSTKTKYTRTFSSIRVKEYMNHVNSKHM